MNATLRLDPQADEAPRFAATPPSLASTAEELAMRACGQISRVPHVVAGSRAASRVGILTYHRVIDRLRGARPPMHNVTPARLSEQISGLLDRGWQFWPLRRMLQWRKDHGPLPEKTAVVTFDDAFESVFHHAWPILRQWQIPFTVFVCTQYLDSDAAFPFDLWGLQYEDRLPKSTYRCMTAAQCRELLDSGLVELGAHTHSHQDFRGRADAFGRDLRLNVELLRARFGISTIPFAYPYGSRRRGFAGPDFQTAAREAGVTCGLTTQAVLVDPASDQYQWGRFNVFSWDTSATLAAKLAGWYSWTNRLRNWRSHTVASSLSVQSTGEGGRDHVS
jgi:peptidoglycan/xylan/chitin deacetylase (PgdA/CDA1 family)